MLLNMLAKGHGYGAPGRSVKDYFAVEPPPDIETESNSSGLLEGPASPQVRLISVNDIRDAIAKGIPQGLRVSFADPTEWETAVGWFEILLALQQLGAFVSRRRRAERTRLLSKTLQMGCLVLGTVPLQWQSRL